MSNPNENNVNGAPMPKMPPLMEYDAVIDQVVTNTMTLIMEATEHRTQLAHMIADEVANRIGLIHNDLLQNAFGLKETKARGSIIIPGKH